MGFCTKCGKELNENDRFCFHCGEPIPELRKQVVHEENNKETTKERKQETWDSEKNQKTEEPIVEKTQHTKTEEPLKKETKQKNIFADKRTIILIVIAIIVVGILVIIGGAFLKKGKGDSDSDVSKKLLEDVQYNTYTNDTVFFSLDYPQGYQVTEPNTNNVVITESNEADFQVVIEYTYHTVSNSAIYSADDFAAQIQADFSVFTDWVGVSELNMTSQQQTTVAGMKCYEYCFDFMMDNNQHAGKLYLFDSMSDCGCYSFMTVVNENVELADAYKELANTMLQSFRITGQCMPEGYQVYDNDTLGLQLMVRNDAAAKITESSSGDAVAIYPIEGIYTECSIWISESTFGTEKEMVSALQSSCSYYLEYKDNAQYLSQPIELEYGRYPCLGIDLQYYDDGVKKTVSNFLLKVGDAYWKVTMDTTDAYYNTAALAVSDVLFSIMFDNLPVPLEETAMNNMSSSTGTDNSTVQKDTNETVQKSNTSSDSKSPVADIIAQIENTAGFQKNAGEQGIVADMNFDGIEDFLATYIVENSEGILDVMYEVWTLPSTGPVKLKSGLVFSQVGGNSGMVSVVLKDNTHYLVVGRNEPEGDKFNSYNSYFEWSTDKPEIIGGGYYLEGHGNYEDTENGRYIWGATKIDYDTFVEYQLDFSETLYRLNILLSPDTNHAKAFADFK